MSTHVPGFQSFFKFLHHFVLAKVATSSIRVNIWSLVEGVIVSIPCCGTPFQLLSQPCCYICQIQIFDIVIIQSWCELVSLRPFIVHFAEGKYDDHVYHVHLRHVLDSMVRGTTPSEIEGYSTQ